MKMTAADLVAQFRAMVGWEYEMGAARYGCVDCSGAFVYAMRQYGLSIYHGSNTIWRQWLTEKGKIGEIAMVPGMAVFKMRMDGGTEDFYHIGLFVGDDRVIEAKGKAYGVVESALSSWGYAGRVKDIDYDGSESAPTEQAQVTADSGNTVNLRDQPNGKVVKQVPVGSTVDVLSRDGTWAKVRYQGTGGYMMETFLKAAAAGETDTLTVSRKELEAIYEAIGRLLEVYG